MMIRLLPWAIVAIGCTVMTVMGRRWEKSNPDPATAPRHIGWLLVVFLTSVACTLTAWGIVFRIAGRAS